MANPVTEAAGFGKKHFFGFLVIVLLTVILVVALEARKPGRLSGLIARIPLVGRRIVGLGPVPTAATPAKV